MTKPFDQAFREDAVKMALEKKVSQKCLAENLGVEKSTLCSWISAYKKGHKIVSGESPEQKEIRRLNIEILREKRDI